MRDIGYFWHIIFFFKITFYLCVGVTLSTQCNIKMVVEIGTKIKFMYAVFSSFLILFSLILDKSEFPWIPFTLTQTTISFRSPFYQLANIIVISAYISVDTVLSNIWKYVSEIYSLPSERLLRYDIAEILQSLSFIRIWMYLRKYLYDYEFKISKVQNTL